MAAIRDIEWTNDNRVAILTHRHSQALSQRNGIQRWAWEGDFCLETRMGSTYTGEWAVGTGLFNFHKRESKELVSAACEGSFMFYLKLRAYYYACTLARYKLPLDQSGFRQTNWHWGPSHFSAWQLSCVREPRGRSHCDQSALGAGDSSRISIGLEQPYFKSAFLRTLRGSHRQGGKSSQHVLTQGIPWVLLYQGKIVLLCSGTLTAGDVSDF